MGFKLAELHLCVCSFFGNIHREVTALSSHPLFLLGALRKKPGQIWECGCQEICGERGVLQCTMSGPRVLGCAAGASTVTLHSHRSAHPSLLPASSKSSMSSSSSLRKFHSDGFPAQVACDLAPPPQEVMPHSPPWSLTADWLSSLCSEARQTAPAPSPEPPADPCPQPPSGLQGIASFSLAAAFSSFHVPGWLPGSAKAQTWLQGNRDRHSSFIT